MAELQVLAYESGLCSQCVITNCRLHRADGRWQVGYAVDVWMPLYTDERVFSFKDRHRRIRTMWAEIVPRPV